MTAANTLSTTARRESKRFAKFLVVGAIGFVVDFASFNVMLRVLNLDRVLAQTLSFALAVTSNFIWNRRWTYPESRSKSIARQFGQFFVLNLIAWLVRTPIFIVLSPPLTSLVVSLADSPLAGLLDFATRTLHATIQQLGYNVALGCAVIVVMFWNFFANRFITYSDVRFGR